ncbi:dihydrofolate reductase [Tychonema sp. LEGE 07199]|uniref:dihydrofolate reductase family protein n=1 Tax=unclassified Tychonema TaxID=2642144 RepID=UPI001880C30D|nr:MULTISPECIES: dihydrofolate reductase family protein [unclassified Tychonema]MBE9121225.1 dihydrofolate reductase [Tychonema sp. LEGE 07199]MBE9133534.1 dihydrofolate reductase [Tychonema sp. LEGE 07196]
MRKLKYYIACTVDGFIAREDGSFDCFPMSGEHFADLFEFFPETIPAHVQKALGISPENKQFDAVLMGRNTYEVGLNVGLTNPYPSLKQYVFSRTMETSPDENVKLVSDNPVAFVKELKKEAGKDIWLCGGGNLAATLVSEIDEMIVKLNPVVIGAGIPVFGRAIEPTNLELVDRKIYSNGFMLLHYRLHK